MKPAAALLFCAALYGQLALPAWQRRALDEFLQFLSIPNVASDAANIRRNADALSKMMRRRGMAVRMLETPGAPPVVFGEVRAAGATKTLVFYAHYDGQPVAAKEWRTGDPFRPMVENGRIVARSASDDKGAIMAMLAALDRMHAAGKQPGSNLKFVFEGEEEAGSPHLGGILEANRELLGGDVWLICDGPVYPNGQQEVYFGARGDMSLDLTLYGPRREVHSGHYGNWAPNPAAMLARLLASMRDDEGRVLVRGFYNGLAPLGETEKRAIAEAPEVEGALRQELWLGGTEGGGRALQQLINLPALNIRGLSSANTGALARNVIPESATAAIDIRLVKGIDYRATEQRVRAHIAQQGFFVVDHDPDENTLRSHSRVAKLTLRPGAYDAARTPMDTPLTRGIVETLERVHGPVVRLPTLGGSVPLYLIEEILQVPFVGVPIANHDNNQHSANENLKLENLWNGVDTMAALFGMQ